MTLFGLDSAGDALDIPGHLARTAVLVTTGMLVLWLINATVGARVRAWILEWKSRLDPPDGKS